MMENSTVIVRMEPSDVFRGECYSRQNCALALAIQRATGDKGWNVDGDAIVHEGKDIFTPSPEWLDDCATDFDQMLDEDHVVYGMDLFEFSLNIRTGDVGEKQSIGYVSTAEIAAARKLKDLYANAR